LDRMQKQEAKLQKKLAKVDSLALWVVDQMKILST